MPMRIVNTDAMEPEIEAIVVKSSFAFGSTALLGFFDPYSPTFEPVGELHFQAIAPNRLVSDEDKRKLRECYFDCLSKAFYNGFLSIGIPLIDSGAELYPKSTAMEIAIHAVADFMAQYSIFVYLDIPDEASDDANAYLLDEIEAFIDSIYVGGDGLSCSEVRGEEQNDEDMLGIPLYGIVFDRRSTDDFTPMSDDLLQRLNELDESFSEMLLRLIDEKGLTDAQCYRKAGIDRRHFSRIRSDRDYRPSKTTVLCFAIALKLSFDETEALLRKAGFALTHSSKFDVIIEFFIKHGNYDMFLINDTLYKYDQNLLFTRNVV